ncbi:MAG: peptidase M14 [Ignavibacteriae bacterium]|nr:peptidase M14 [Ignavibacteriota bacterium]NOG96740.1 peptidase M14 [Ignavibacteriota bacterium]
MPKNSSSANLILLLFTLTFFNISNAQPVDSNWLTHFEKSNYLETPNYDQTIEFFQQLSDSSEKANLITFGKSPQGRDIKCLIAAEEKEFTTLANVKKSGKPIVLIMNGIHSGEIEGKDACMLLLRDILITKEKESLLENAVLMVIPVFSVDGHERISPYNRINQNGPAEMGWRTTAKNLNLNRDFMKADAEEMRAFLRLFSTVLPDFFIDVHASNGADYQYTITYQIERHGFTHPIFEKWANEKFIPFVEKQVEDDGFLISPFVGFIDGDVRNGIYDWIASPRFSNGYASLQNTLGLLIETHMLKPYKERVFSTLSLLTAVLELVNSDNENILEMNAKAEQDRMKRYGSERELYPYKFKRTNDYDTFIYKGLKPIEKFSEITGGKINTYTDIPVEYEVPYYNKDSVTNYIDPPLGYIVPAEWKSIIEICDAHGINYIELNDDKLYTVEKIKFRDVEFASFPYEGRFIPSYNYDKTIEEFTASKGSFYIPVKQRTVGVILNLFEPDASDSFVKWGFFNTIFEQKEYFENYSMEPIAKKMLAEQPELKKEFEEKLKSDEDFRNDPYSRLNFFYENSPYYDQQLNVYPILRVLSD